MDKENLKEFFHYKTGVPVKKFVEDTGKIYSMSHVYNVIKGTSPITKRFSMVLKQYIEKKTE